MIRTREWPRDEYGVEALSLMAMWVAVWSRCEPVVECDEVPTDSARYLGEV